MSDRSTGGTVPRWRFIVEFFILFLVALTGFIFLSKQGEIEVWLGKCRTASQAVLSADSPENRFDSPLLVSVVQTLPIKPKSASIVLSALIIRDLIVRN